MSTVAAAATTHDVCENDVGGPLGHPPQPVQFAVDSSDPSHRLTSLYTQG